MPISGRAAGPVIVDPTTARLHHPPGEIPAPIFRQPAKASGSREPARLGRQGMEGAGPVGSGMGGWREPAPLGPAWRDGGSRLRWVRRGGMEGAGSVGSGVEGWREPAPLGPAWRDGGSRLRWVRHGGMEGAGSVGSGVEGWREPAPLGPAWGAWPVETGARAMARRRPRKSPAWHGTLCLRRARHGTLLARDRQGTRAAYEEPCTYGPGATFPVWGSTCVGGGRPLIATVKLPCGTPPLRSAAFALPFKPANTR